jgi:hypothetical protein
MSQKSERKRPEQSRQSGKRALETHAESVPRNSKANTSRTKQQECGDTIQFRIDEDTKQRMTAIAEEKKTPPGILARMWMVERLREEEGKSGIQPNRQM